MRRHRISFGSVAKFTVAALVLAGCTSGPSPTTSSSAAPVTPQDGGHASLGGVSVTIPAGGVASQESISISSTDELTNVPAGATPRSALYSVVLGGAELSKPATITFPKPRGADPLVVLWQDGRGGWEPLPTRVAGDRVTAQTTHFSGGFLASIDIKKWSEDRARDLGQYISGRSGVAQPMCGDEAAARTGGVKVSSDGGDSVKWCFGVQDGERVLKIANNRRTFTTVTYPKAWKVKDGSSVTISTDTLVRALGTWAAEVYPGNRAARVIDGGDTLTLVVPAKGGGAVEAQDDVLTWALSGIVFGLDVASGVKGAFGLEAGDVAGRFLSVLTAGGPDFESYTTALKTCTKAMTSLVDSNLDGAKLAQETLKFAFKCVPSIASVDLKATGMNFFGAGIVLQGVVGAISLILTAANLLVTAVRQIWDDVASFAGKSDNVYDIVIRTPQPELTLGVPWGPYQTGYGQVRPHEIFNGGDPSGGVSDITWTSWGGSIAVGTGTAEWVPDGAAVAAGYDEKAVVYAWDPGPCAGQLRYRMINWYFPGEPTDEKPDFSRTLADVAASEKYYYDYCDPNWRDYMDTFTPAKTG